MKTVKKHSFFLQAILLLLASLLMVTLACEKGNVTGVEEEFAVRANLEVRVIDPSGLPVDAPVTFSIGAVNTPAGEAIPERDIYVISAGAEGIASFSYQQILKAGESFDIIADVSSDKFESVNYWTAWFRAEDAPLKHVNVTMTVLPRN